MWVITLVRIILVVMAIFFFSFLVLVGLMAMAQQHQDLVEQQAMPLVEFQYMSQDGGPSGTRRSRQRRKTD